MLASSYIAVQREKGASECFFLIESTSQSHILEDHHITQQTTKPTNRLAVRFPRNNKAKGCKRQWTRILQ